MTHPSAYRARKRSSVEVMPCSFFAGNHITCTHWGNLTIE